MKIAIDARGINWYKGTGIGTYTENVLTHLLQLDSSNRYHIYWAGEGCEQFYRENTKLNLASNKHHRFFEQCYFPYDLSRQQADIFHVPQNGIGLFEEIPCKKIVTIHDLIPYIMPETVGKGYLLKFLKEVPKVIELADAIITVSEWSKKDILRFFPVEESKVYVTPLAADEKYHPLDREWCKTTVREHYGIQKPFILYIGGFSARKNVKSLLLAFSRIYYSLPEEYQLVIVGANKDQGSQLSELSASLDVAGAVLFTGYVPDQHLPVLYNAADVFVYPSFYEGFGLPPLEAMSCGTPVITSNVTSIPEVVKDGGMLIDPHDMDALEHALVDLLCSEKLLNHYRRKGLEVSKSFSWLKTAEDTLKVYEAVQALPPPLS